MSKSYASAQAGTVSASENRLTSRSACGSGTAEKIGSWPNSGSSGKYIWVTRRWTKARPNSEKWMCAGRQALAWFPHG